MRSRSLALSLSRSLALALSRALATFYLEQSVTLIGKLPTDMQTRPDILEKSAGFKTSLAAILGTE